MLSKSTQDCDRGDKFIAYRTIPTFQEYLLIDQYSYQVEHYAKDGVKRWVFQAYNQPEEVVELATLPFTVALSDIYAKVAFEPIEPIQ